MATTATGVADRFGPLPDGAVVVAAPAKVNLALHVTGRRADGYHLLDSLVAFTGPDEGDTLAVEFAELQGADTRDAGGVDPEGDANPGGAAGAAVGTPDLVLAGPFAAALPTGADNIVVRAAAVVGGVRRVWLWKGLPVASGIGGGSADAAAVLRAAAIRRGVDAATYAAAALTLGADVPACLSGRSCRMAGIGEALTPVALPSMPAVLVNSGVPVATRDVFAALAARDNPPLPPLPRFDMGDALVRWLAGTRNDLEAPAVTLAPAIGAALDAVRAAPGCRLARMSGSGATVFGLFADVATRDAAAGALARPGWWVRGVTLGG